MEAPNSLALYSPSATPPLMPTTVEGSPSLTELLTLSPTPTDGASLKRGWAVRKSMRKALCFPFSSWFQIYTKDCQWCQFFVTPCSLIVGYCAAYPVINNSMDFIVALALHRCVVKRSCIRERVSILGRSYPDMTKDFPDQARVRVRVCK
jgi:hypothetical protein